jgi:hypothetical protein
MSAFSYTAPRFTEEQEQKERESTTEEEENVVSSDIFGVDAVIEETEELVIHSLAQFEEELAALPEKDKQGYSQALEECPLIVEQESAPIRFLRAEDYDAKRAAIRLTKYWDNRVELFGPDSAFLPMTLDGAMANDAQAFKALGDGNYMLPYDKHGRAVYFSDKSRSTNERLTKDEQLRIIWYYVHASIEDESVQRTGFIMMADMRVTKLSHFNRAQSIDQFHHVQNVLPMKVRAMHVCHVPYFVEQWLIPIAKFILGKHLRLRLLVHISSTLPKELVKYGFKIENLPVCVGGTYHHDPAHWLESRRVLEDSRR